MAKKKENQGQRNDIRENSPECVEPVNTNEELAQVMLNIVDKYESNETLFVDGVPVNRKDLKRIKIIRINGFVAGRMAVIGYFQPYPSLRWGIYRPTTSIPGLDRCPLPSVSGQATSLPSADRALYSPPLRYTWNTMHEGWKGRRCRPVVYPQYGLYEAALSARRRRDAAPRLLYRTFGK